MPTTFKPALLDRPTVFVLGAGASKAFGFPLGSELKQQMLGVLNKRTHARLQKLGFGQDLLAEFQDCLKYTFHPTIDIFLEHKTNFRELGSYLIASTIMPLENPDRLLATRDWYWDLFRVLAFDGDSPETSHLAVVTLNYDRSFEHYMAKTIDFNCRHDRVAHAHERRQRIRIVHAHGSLGDYPGTPFRPNPDDEASVRRAAASIKIVSDRLEDSPEFKAALQLLEWAQNIVFLGFGYNERTLSGLMPNGRYEEKKFYGTAVNLNDEQKRQITEMFHNRITLGGVGEDCAAFLRRIAVFPNK